MNWIHILWAFAPVFVGAACLVLGTAVVRTLAGISLQALPRPRSAVLFWGMAAWVVWGLGIAALGTHRLAIAADITEAFARETRAVHELEVLASGLSPDARVVMRQEVRDYAALVLASEWPGTGPLRPSPEAEAQFERIWSTVLALESNDARQLQLYSAAVSAATHVGAARSERLRPGTGTLGPISGVWLGISTLTLLVLGSAACAWWSRPWMWVVASLLGALIGSGVWFASAPIEAHLPHRAEALQLLQP
jgi:hypothetical protein